MTVPVDNPIQDPSYDLLERTPFARSFAEYVCALDACEGVVVGVYGSWGSGKTSFLNLAKHAFRDISVDVLEFDPWHFSGTGQLLNRFFEDISKKIGKLTRSDEISRNLAIYGGLIGIGLTVLPETPVILALSKFVSYLFQRKCQSEGIEETRHEIARELSKRKSPIVIMIDDLDRLTGEEVLEVFKLVRLVGRFPNLVYIIACDREQIERALAGNQDNHSGRQYMEKIIQYPVSLPEISDRMLFYILDHKLRDVLDSVSQDKVINNDRWPDIRSTIVFPLVTNLRYVNRFLAVVRATVVDLNGLVTAVDVVALEAVRMFLPDTFIMLPTIIDVLTVDLDDQESKQEDRERFVPHEDSFHAGWNQHKNLEFQRKKAKTMLGYRDQDDSQAQDVEESDRIESMVISSLIDHVFPLTRVMIAGKSEEQYFRSLVDDWKRAFIRRVFEKYLARAVGRKDGI